MALAITRPGAAGDPVTEGERDRPPLLVLFAPADHPHRDAVCATLAWLAAAEGLLFECYYDSFHSGAHYGGGDPADADPADLRGGTFTGGRHLEQFYLVLQRFRCQAACLGPTVFAGPLRDSGIPVRSWSGDVARFYRDVFAASPVAWPSTLLVVGDGECEGVRLLPFAHPEVVHRRLLAIADGDPDARRDLASGMVTETLWTTDDDDRTHASRPDAAGGGSIAERTAWMAERWAHRSRGFLLGDHELAGRWIPGAVRHGLAPIHGVPQVDVIERLAARVREQAVVVGRQQDDRDFLALSRLGTAFQLVDAGRPPFPVVREAPGAWPVAPACTEPGDDDLRRWSREGRVLTTALFWSGMARELENLYALADLLSLTGLSAGLVLTTESYAYMTHPPLTLVQVPRELGGLAPRVELLLASGGMGALLESEAPRERFASTLRTSVEQLSERLGGRHLAPMGWWSTMDAPLLWHGTRRVGARARPPFLRLRYQPRRIGGPAGSAGDSGRRTSLRSRVRRTPLRHLFDPIRPFDGYRPGPPQRALLEAVRDAGFEYALTKSSFGGPPLVVSGVPGLTVLNYTAGRWDGWTPFVTVNDLGDLEAGERRLLRRGRPGWLVGGLDTCLWAFTGTLWERSGELHRICEWIAGGGSSGRLVNVTPRTVARYARILADGGLVGSVPAR